jgi:hypothetical protein
MVLLLRGAVVDCFLAARMTSECPTSSGDRGPSLGSGPLASCGSRWPKLLPDSLSNSANLWPVHLSASRGADAPTCMDASHMRNDEKMAPHSSLSLSKTLASPASSLTTIPQSLPVLVASIRYCRHRRGCSHSLVVDESVELLGF